MVMDHLSGAGGGHYDRVREEIFPPKWKRHEVDIREEYLALLKSVLLIWGVILCVYLLSVPPPPLLNIPGWGRLLCVSSYGIMSKCIKWDESMTHPGKIRQMRVCSMSSTWVSFYALLLAQDALKGDLVWPNLSDLRLVNICYMVTAHCSDMLWL